MLKMKSTEAAKRFGALTDLARTGPVIIESHGRESLVVMSASEFRAMQAKAAHRQVLVAGEIPDDVMQLIQSAVPAPESAAFNHEVDGA